MPDTPDTDLRKVIDERPYSREFWEKDYKRNVYYKQRKGGENWFHGRVSMAYKDNYDKINWKKE